jgi:4-amino-4-deoxychorismate lyase
LQFLETICIKDGMPRHLEWHQQRVDATLKHFHSEVLPVDRMLQLHEVLSSCTLPAEGIWRCRIVYDLNAVSIEFIPEEKAQFHTLRMIEAPEHLDYLYKYADRQPLYALFENRNGADDVLMLRQGWITDTTKANIAFRAEDKWYTPSVPLLAGTTWKRLVASGVILPRPIHQKDIPRYEAFRIINALNDWGGEEYPVDGILG